MIKVHVISKRVLPHAVLCLWPLPGHLLLTFIELSQRCFSVLLLSLAMQCLCLRKYANLSRSGLQRI